MEVYSTEEEQVQAIQKWWKDNLFSVIAGVVIGFAVIAGYRYWSDYTQTQSQHASVLYSQILSGDVKDKSEISEMLKNKYSGTPYASLAALLQAKDLINTNEIDKAINQLLWAKDNTKDDAVKHIAQTRLARLYLNQNNIAAAEALIQGVKVAGFSATYDEIRGDINLAKKMPVQARENYNLALAALTPGDQRYVIIKMKLDDLTAVTTGVVAK